MFLWGILPEGMDAADVLKARARKEGGVRARRSISPAAGGRENTMRINFSYSSPEVIREGVTRLGTTLKELIREKETV